ncbi:MAG: hypothetical protein BWY95_02774 [Bacteroidetes bacterium ADurb.BinA104]|nr:MAG: hypothetical protein BWY95_02774 [Bacteroidetes bacterium ADurb.BinA104]
MNPLNYASLEASKRLVEAGIVLETDFYWASVDMENWSLCTIPHKVGFKEYPAPSMSEVWRELPYAATIYKGPRYNSAWIEHGMDNTEIYKNNPTDALIDLLIWVRKEASNDHT